MDAAMHAERALLGAILSDPNGQRGMLRLVTPDDFYRPWHGQVLAAIPRLDSRGVSPGPREVYAELNRDPDLPRSVADDAVPLADLVHVSPRGSHAPVYAGIVIGSAIRRHLTVSGGRLRQAGHADADPVDDRVLEAARRVVARERRDTEVSARRWGRLPAAVRQELPAALGASRPNAEIAWRARQVRDELVRLREDLWAEDRTRVAERLATIAGQLAEESAQAMTQHEQSHNVSMVSTAGPHGADAEAAGLTALRDLIASPRLMNDIAGWLQPSYFARPRHGTIYQVIADLHQARMPVDPVTVSWQAARRGVTVEPRELAGGYGAFAQGSAAQVYRRAVLADVQQVGLDIQASASDPRQPIVSLLHVTSDRLAAAEHDLAPERCRVPSRAADVLALPAKGVRRAPALSARAEAEWEAAQ
jgi:hypothetical protein